MSTRHPLEIPDHVTLAVGQGGLQKVMVETLWSSAEVYLHGAHVTRFCRKGEEALLFMSDSSEFTPQKAIRGGVPIIFPWFGKREAAPAHGFARTSLWELTGTRLLADQSVILCFQMPSTDRLKVEYRVTVGDTLSMELIVTNLADQDSSFENCLHSYFHISAINVISISGLAGSRYFDLLKGSHAVETAAAIHFAGEVDRTYLDTSAVIEIADPGFNRTIRIEKSGSRSTVVWNPWIDKSKAMADFGDRDYLQMVCVESGNIGENKLTLPAGGSAVLRVAVSSSPITTHPGGS